MRKNRKVSKRMSRLSVHTMHIGVVLITFFAVIVLNLVAGSSCSRLRTAIAENEKVLAQVKAERDRNILRWEEAKASKNLDLALVRRGMAMRRPELSQIVRMDGDGHVLPSQTSVAILQRRKEGRATASLDPAAGRGRRVRRVMR